MVGFQDLLSSPEQVGGWGGASLARGAGFQDINDGCQIRGKIQFSLNLGYSGECEYERPLPYSQGVSSLKGKTRLWAKTSLSRSLVSSSDYYQQIFSTNKVNSIGYKAHFPLASDLLLVIDES